MSNKLGGSLV